MEKEKYKKIHNNFDINQRNKKATNTTNKTNKSKHVVVKSASWLVKFVKLIFYLIFFGVLLLIFKFLFIIFSESKEYSYTEPISKNTADTELNAMKEAKEAKDLKDLKEVKNKGEKQK